MPKANVLLRVGCWLSLAAATAAAWSASDRAFRAREVTSAVVIQRDVPFHEPGGHPLTLDLYLPASPAPEAGRPAILAIHGGSWIGGSKRMFRPGPWDPHPAAVALAESGFVVVVPDYRLARPGAPAWPAARDDLREALRWIRSNAHELGVDPDRVAAFGQSAGGHLAAILGTSSGLAGADDQGRVGAVVSFYGPSDLVRLPSQRVQPLAHEPVRAFLGEDPRPDPDAVRAASPIHLVDRATAPMLLVHGSLDLWVPISQSEGLARALEASGVPHRLIRVEGARHGFGLRIADPGTRDPHLLDEMLAFLGSVWNASLAEHGRHP